MRVWRIEVSGRCDPSSDLSPSFFSSQNFLLNRAPVTVLDGGSFLIRFNGRGCLELSSLKKDTPSRPPLFFPFDDQWSALAYEDMRKTASIVVDQFFFIIRFFNVHILRCSQSVASANGSCFLNATCLRGLR